MNLTTRARYAVTALLDLTLQGNERPVPLMDISRRQQISLTYLEQLFSKLKKEHLVESVRGPGGGYRLGRLEKDISVAQIASAVSESTDMTKCGGQSNCHNGNMCLTHWLWVDLGEKIYEFLENVTLAHLVQRHEQDNKLTISEVKLNDSHNKSDLREQPVVATDRVLGMLKN